MNNFYVYGYIRSMDSVTAPKGSFYYIGKGRGNRAYRNHGKIKVPEDRSQITIISENLSESSAFDLEKELIAKYGRKDIGTGILLNRTDGGEGQSGLIMSVEARKKISEKKTGKKLGNQSQSHIENKSKSRISKRPPIQCIDTGQIFENPNDVCVWLNIEANNQHRNFIYRCCNGTRNLFCGYRWKFIGVDTKIWQPKKRIPKTSRKVKCIETGQIFDIAADAVRWLKTIGFEKADSSLVTGCCKGKYAKGYGYTWCWA